MWSTGIKREGIMPLDLETDLHFFFFGWSIGSPIQNRVNLQRLQVVGCGFLGGFRGCTWLFPEVLGYVSLMSSYSKSHLLCTLEIVFLSEITS